MITFKGAITGLFCGLIMSLWIGFGQPKPPSKMLKFSTEGCSAFGNNITTKPISFTLPSTESPIQSSLTEIKDESSYFYLYRISYMWYVVIGFFVALTVGYITSVILERLNKAGEIKIYTDNTQMFYNTDLFSPPIAKRLKIEMAKKLEATGFTNAMITGRDSFKNANHKKDSTGF